VYELKLPDGSALDPKVVEATVAFAKEHKIAPEVAQKLLETRDADRKAYSDHIQAEFDQRVQKWETDAKADPELAGKDGKQFDTNVQLAMRARDKFANPALRQLLNETGFGNHPEVIKFFVRVGAAMKEDTFIPPGAPPPPPAKDVSELFYPSKQP
jgi:hypothetical protein